MKKAKREEYWILSLLEDDLPKNIRMTTSLCAWCRYAEWTGCCEDSELYCRHPLDAISEHEEDTWSGGDCWGFDPWLSREDAVDICGLYLQGFGSYKLSVPRLKGNGWKPAKSQRVW